MTNTANTTRALGYVRVSRVGGRSGSSFISPEEQRDTITRLAAANGLELVDVVEEMDTSGGKSAEARQLGELVERIEKGEASALVCWKVSRMSRSLVDGVLTASRITEAGGRLVASDIDTGQPMGKALLGLMLGLAEEELDARRAGWAAAVTRAVTSGRFVGARVPVGYRKRVRQLSAAGLKNPDPRVIVEPDVAPEAEGRLEVHPVESEAVRRCFEARARGASWSAIVAILGEAGVRVSPSGAQSILKSRTYRGEVFSGKVATAGAHPELVEEQVWQLAQRPGKAGRPQGQHRTGALASVGFLAGGLAVCATCGARLGVTTNGDGQVSMKCRPGRLEKCPAPASITMSHLEDYVRPMLMDRLDANTEALEARGMYVACQLQLETAEADLAAFLKQAQEPGMMAAMGDSFAPALAQYRARVTEVGTDLERWADRLEAGDAITGGDFEGLAIQAQRRAAAAHLQRVAVEPAGGRGIRRPVEDRVTITWR